MTAPKVEKWGLWEETFTAAEEGPVDDFLVQLIAPSGEKRQTAGFWDGGRVWRVRFMPDEEGVWRVATRANPAIEGLEREQRTFVCVEPEPDGNPLTEHGPIRVASSGRHFEHADGTPWLWIADTAWNGALFSSESGWDEYLSGRAEKGFTAIQFVTTQWRAAMANAEGQKAYSGVEDIEIHPEFFARMDARINRINEMGLVAAPVLLWDLGDDPEWTPGLLPEEQAIELARYLAARYSGHHVVWFLGGDGNYGGEEAERWKRIGRAVFGGANHAPALLHPRGMRWPWPEHYVDEEWHNIWGYQSGHGDSDETLAWIHSGPPARDWDDYPPRPLINLEPPYEGHVAYHSKEPHSAHNVRRAIYWSLFNAPAAGVSYGAHGIWSWQKEPGEPLNHKGSGIAPPWREAAEMPGSTHLSIAAGLLRSINWWELRPAPELLAVQPGEDDPAKFQSAAMTISADVALIYLPEGGEATLSSEAAVAGFTKASWFNPRTGERQEISFAKEGTYRAPDEGDWLLVLTK